MVIMRRIILFVIYFQSVFCKGLLKDSIDVNLFQHLQQRTVNANHIKLTRDTVTADVGAISLYVYTQSDRNGTQIGFSNASSVTELSSFDPDLKTVIYIHGWIDTFDGEGAVLIRDSLLNTSDLNVIILDWDECGNDINYITSWRCVEGIGNYLGEFLTTVSKTYGYSLDNVTIVGHSLGAHMAGYAGQYTNSSLGFIIGLDPAAPLFSEDEEDTRLSEDDAQYVQGIHTSARFLGVNYNVGIADFWPNGGYSQAGCGFDPFGQCAHVRAYSYYAESVVLDDFVGRECDSYEDFENGDCDDNNAAKMGGLNIDTTIEGVYYLNTNEASPYGQGNL